jgi:hypothetical protein
MSGQLHAPAALPPGGKRPRYSLDRGLGGPQSRSGRRGEEKILDPTGTRTPTPRSSSPQSVAIPTALSRLRLLYMSYYVCEACEFVCACLRALIGFSLCLIQISRLPKTLISVGCILILSLCSSVNFTSIHRTAITVTESLLTLGPTRSLFSKRRVLWESRDLSLKTTDHLCVVPRSILSGCYTTSYST